MPDKMSLIELVTGLVRDPAERAEFHSDPAGYLAASGNSGAGAEDIQDALTLVDERVADIGHVPPPPAPHPGESSHEAAVRFLDTVVTNTFPTQTANPVVAEDDIDDVPTTADQRGTVDDLNGGGPDPAGTHGDTGFGSGTAATGEPHVTVGDAHTGALGSTTDPGHDTTSTGHADPLDLYDDVDLADLDGAASHADPHVGDSLAVDG